MAGWDCACGCLAVRMQARVCGFSLQPIVRSVCDVQRCCSCCCRLWRNISVMPFLPFWLYVLQEVQLSPRCETVGGRLKRSTDTRCDGVDAERRPQELPALSPARRKCQ